MLPFSMRYSVRIWVTGAKGMVGSAALKRLGAHGVGTGREVDIADERQVASFLKNNGPFTHIFNCAAYSKVDDAELERQEAMRVNGLGPACLGMFARAQNIQMVHLSTDYVFSGAEKRPYREEDETAPCGYYGLTKLEGEKKLQESNPDCCIIRTSWVFGIGGKNFVVKALDMLKTQPALRIVEDQTSRFTYAPDLVEAMMQMKDQSGLYQFANDEAGNKYQFILELQKQALKKGVSLQCTKIEPVTSDAFAALAKRPLFSAMSTEKIEALLQKRPRSWREALQEYVERYA